MTNAKKSPAARSDYAVRPTGKTFVLFDDGTRDLDREEARLRAERGLTNADTLVIIRRFGPFPPGDVRPDDMEFPEAFSTSAH